MSTDRKLSLSTLVSCALAVLWSKASAVYNWGNIGGRLDPNFEAWYRASGPLAYSSLLVWLTTIGLAIYLTNAELGPRRILWPLVCATAPIAVMWASDVWFHRGFPTLSG